MAMLGIVGGIAPPSTAEYYRSIVALHRELAGCAPRVLITSLDGDEVLGHLAAGRRDELSRILLAGLAQLASAGADIALLASTSVHVVFDELRPRSPLPLVGMAEPTAAALAGHRRVGLLATRFTVEADVYGPALADRGVSVVAPAPDEQATVERVYFGELVHGRFLPESRRALLAIAARLREEAGADAVLLGGTELPLLLPQPAYDGLRFVDAARIHARAAVEAMLR